MENIMPEVGRRLFGFWSLVILAVIVWLVILFFLNKKKIQINLSLANAKNNLLLHFFEISSFKQLIALPCGIESSIWQGSAIENSFYLFSPQQSNSRLIYFVRNCGSLYSHLCTVVCRPLAVILFSAFYLLLSASSFAQYANIEFVENKGQWNELVKYKGEINNGAFFLQQNGFKVLQHSPEDMRQISEIFHGSHADPVANKSNIRIIGDAESFLLHSHAYNVQFVNAASATAMPDKPLASYNNYLLGSDTAKWKGNCKIYQAITYANMYSGIDVRYYTDNGYLKYDIIVQPGANMAQVAMKYDGVEALSIRDKQLIIKTSVGETKELEPYAYQFIDGFKKVVKCNFVLHGHTVSFSTGDYNKDVALIIDPTLVFSTFTGSPADNWGYTATYGADGSFYAGGIVFASGFPVSNGAFQTTFGGGFRDEENIGSYDIGIMKFNTTGTTRVYATYLGGNGNEQPHSMVVSNQGDLVIAGRSNSANYPQRNGQVIGSGGNYDIVITRLDAAGANIVGSRRIGGSAYDGVNIRPKYANPKGQGSIRRNYGDDARTEVLLDQNDNILLASNTQSSNFPVTPGAFQTSLSGLQDGVFLKMDGTLTNMLYATLIGGSGDDAVFVVATNPATGNIYIGGNTTSADLPGNKTGVIYPTFQGQTDGFVSILSPAGVLLATTYIGTPGFDMLYGIQFDRFAFPYIMGTTTGSWPVSSNAKFSQPGGKQFIAKLQPDLSGYVYSTVFGSGAALPNISPIAFLVDRCENVYVSGWGGQADVDPGYPNAGTSGLPITGDAFQRTTDNSDFYFFVLEKNAESQLFGSFFGQSGGYGEHVDGGTSRFDRNGIIYQGICANCGHNANFPTTPGVWSRTNESVECNLAAIKIAFNFSGIAGSVRSSISGVISDTIGCVPLTVTFTDTLAEGKSYLWDFGDGSSAITTTTPNIQHTFGSIGNYRVRLISVDSLKCNISDTAFVTIRVKTDKATPSFTVKKLLPCNAFNYRFVNNTMVDPPGKLFNSTSFQWSFGDNSPVINTGNDTQYHSFPSAGVYIVRLTVVDTNFCNAPETVYDTLRIAVNVKAAFVTPLQGCAPYEAYFNNTSDAGETFLWNFGDGTTSTAQYPTHLYYTPGSYTIKLVVTDSGTCNRTDSTFYTIIVSNKPHSAFTYTPQPPRTNEAIHFVNEAVGAVRYKWIFGDGEEINTATTESVQHIYNATNDFMAMLVATNISGCSDTARELIDAKVLPLLDVPNAFTPNNDGINDIVAIRGFGIAKMSWRIYNRWGTVVFETSDRNQPWDGKYKGEIQPAEVYHYILTVQYSDKTSVQKIGDITLLK